MQYKCIPIYKDLSNHSTSDAGLAVTFYIEYSNESKDSFNEFIKSHDNFFYIKHLEWDSRFFNKKSYILDVDKSQFVLSDELALNLKSNLLNSFTTIKIETKNSSKIIDFFQEGGFKYIETEVSLRFNGYSDLTANEYSIDEIVDNENIPYQLLGSTFIYTRFHSDINIENSKAEQLWVTYLKNYSPSENRKMFVAYDNQEVIGVTLVNISNVNEIKEAMLFYVAVVPEYQNRGVGKSMINYVTNYLINSDISIIKTGTQAKNVNALNFYLRNGFSLINNTLTVLHRWS